MREKLTQILIQKRMTITALARELKVSQPWLSLFLNGWNPTEKSENLKKIIKHLEEIEK